MTAEPPSAPLLAVKHTVPPVRARAVPRDRLVDELRRAGTRLTTVVAPAGWGKTSVLSAWASRPGDERIAWVSLDEDDDEPGRFWAYVLTALHTVSDDVGSSALDALSAPGLGAVDLALPILLNELATATSPHVIVLDDYHAIADPLVHEGVEFLVSYLPPSARLVLAGRWDPPLPLARLRARADLTELRVADLRFTADEATALLTEVAGSPLDATTIDAVRERTEGWAAGLQLTGLALRGNGGTAVGADRHLLDYFTAEVLPALAPGHRDLLVRAAPLERLSGALCDAALQVTGSSATLDALERSDLFVVPLDAGRRWYRCHRILRDVLLRDESPAGRDDRTAVLRRAAAWFEEQGRIDDAIRHLLRSDDTHAAAALLASSEEWFFEHGAAAGYLELGEQLPVGLVTPPLALALAYAASTCGRAGRILPWLDACDDRMTDDVVVSGWRDGRAASLTMRALLGIADADADMAVDLCRQAVALEHEGGSTGHPMATAALGTALARAGRFAEAEPILSDSWHRRDRGAWSAAVTLQIEGVLSLCLLELDRGDRADAVLRAALPRAYEAERRWGAAASPLVALSRVVAGRRSYQRGNDAREELVAAAAHADLVTRPTTRVLAHVFLADAHLACGDRAAARTALARAREIVDDQPATPFAMRRLDDAEVRVGRSATRSARRSGALAEELTDRELTILRALTGPASQREVGAALFLSINTVKAYNKSLYRKLGVASRKDAVAVARDLGLI